MSHLRIFNPGCILTGDYRISSNRSPRLVLDTLLVFETRLLLEEIQYRMLNILNGDNYAKMYMDFTVIIAPWLSHHPTLVRPLCLYVNCMLGSQRPFAVSKCQKPDIQ